MSGPARDQPYRYKKARLVLAALAFVAVSLACSISLPTLPSATPGATLTAPALTLPAATLTAPAATLGIPDTGPGVSGPPVGLIAYVGVDGNIYTIDRDGQNKSTITQDANVNPTAGQTARVYQYPTWALDGRHLAFMRYSNDSSGPAASLITALADGTKPVEAFTSQDTQPFYLFWSPDSQTVSFLSNDSSGGGLALYLSAAAGGSTHVLDTGNPYYWDWSPDNRALIVHVGGAFSDNPDARLALVEPGDTVKVTELDLKPGYFQAPAWSPAGDELALLAQKDTGDEELALVGRDGKLKQVAATADGPASFAWSPKGGLLAFMTLVQLDAGPANQLALIDSARPDPKKQIVQGAVVAYFWSPDGRKIAYFLAGPANPGPTALVAQTSPSNSLTVQVYDLASGVSKKVASFSPTDSFQQVFPFFDQYLRSGTIWSPDSRSLVLAGVDQAGNDAIYVVGADGSQFHQVAAGGYAFWSWK